MYGIQAECFSCFFLSAQLGNVSVCVCVCHGQHVEYSPLAPLPTPRCTFHPVVLESRRASEDSALWLGVTGGGGSETTGGKGLSTVFPDSLPPGPHRAAACSLGFVAVSSP